MQPSRCPLAGFTFTPTRLQHRGQARLPISPLRSWPWRNSFYEKVSDSAYLLTVGGESFEQTEGLSHPVRRAIAAVLTQIKALLSEVSLPVGFLSPSA